MNWQTRDVADTDTKEWPSERPFIIVDEDSETLRSGFFSFGAWTLGGIVAMAVCGSSLQAGFIVTGVAVLSGTLLAWLKNRDRDRWITPMEIGMALSVILGLPFLARIFPAVTTGGFFGMLGIVAFQQGLSGLVFIAIWARIRAALVAKLTPLAEMLRKPFEIRHWTDPLPNRDIEAAAMNLVHPLLSPAAQASWPDAWIFEYLIAPTGGQTGKPAVRLRGLPTLPEGWVWPEKNGEPYTFLAQVDLSVVAEETPHPDLPQDGFLLFFYLENDAMDDGWVIHSTKPCQFPADPSAPPEASGTLMQVCPKWACSPNGNGPFWEELQLMEESEDEEIRRAATVLLWRPDAHHHLLGACDVIQCPVELEWEQNASAAAPPSQPDSPSASSSGEDGEWILLLQLDSDRSIGMYWGDMGCVYFGIRAADLRARRFEKAVMACQYG